MFIKDVVFCVNLVYMYWGVVDGEVIDEEKIFL